MANVIKNCNKERKRLEREKRDIRLGEGAEYNDNVLKFLEGNTINTKAEEIMAKMTLNEEDKLFLRRVAMCRLVSANLCVH